MATLRSYIRCDVCGTVTMVRTQLGWLDQHPVRVYCGECSITLSGTAILDQATGNAHVEFSNAAECAGPNVGFYVEASGELLTEKLQKYDGNPYPLAPFFFTLNQMGGENYAEFKARTLTFLEFTRNDWPRVRRINELLAASDFARLSTELAAVHPKKRIAAKSTLQLRQRARHLNMAFLAPIADAQTMDAFRAVSSVVESLAVQNRQGLRALATYFADQGLLDEAEQLLRNWLEQFVNAFRFQIPVFGLRFYRSQPADLLTSKGVTTVGLNDVKGLYVDSFEIGVDLATFLVAYNNLIHRGDFNRMRNQRKDVKTLDDWRAKSKGTRVEFIDGNEHLDGLGYPHLDSALRNGLAHASCRFDGAGQLISYKAGSSKAEVAIPFVTFLVRLWNLLMSVLALSECVYRTRVLAEMDAGQNPLPPSFYVPPKGKPRPKAR